MKKEKRYYCTKLGTEVAKESQTTIESTDPRVSVFFTEPVLGKTVIQDENGLPVIVDDIVHLTEEEKELGNITEKKEYLKSTDWYIMRKMEEGISIPIEVVEKRKEIKEYLRK